MEYVLREKNFRLYYVYASVEKWNLILYGFLTDNRKKDTQKYTRYNDVNE